MINQKNIQTEVDAGFLYSYLAETESDPNVAKIFYEMADIESGHAKACLLYTSPSPRD